MAKFYGAIGFATDVEAAKGVWQKTVIEHYYRGDILKIYRNQEERDSLNPNLTISNRISIIADAFADNNIFAMRYVSWMGAKWTINSVEVQRPRLILAIGSVYNG